MNPAEHSDQAREFEEASERAFLDAGLYNRAPRRDLGTDEYQAVKEWSPPTLDLTTDKSIERSFELASEVIEGSPVADILPTTHPYDDRLEQLVCRQRVRELPRRLRHLVRQLHHRHLRLQMLDWFDSWVSKVAADEGQFREAVGPGMESTLWYVPAVHRRRTLEALDDERAFVDTVLDRVRETKALGHKLAVHREWPGFLPTDLPKATFPLAGTMNTESRVGLQQTSMIEDLPEGAHVRVARRIWSRLRGRRGERRDEVQRLLSKAKLKTVGKQAGSERLVGSVLHWGALTSTLTLALKATAPVTPEGKEPRVLDIDEFETLGEPRALPWVRYRGARLRDRRYDVVVAHLPPPGVGGNQLRNRYKDIQKATTRQRETEDMGRFGPKRWLKYRRKLLPELVRRTKLDGELVLFVPLAARAARRERGRRLPVWSYEPMPELADGVTQHLGELAMEVVADVLVEELYPIRQAILGKERSPWRCIVARHRLDHDDLGMGFDEEWHDA